MGYPIYREVKVYAPATLTHREKLVALILADDANDGTRMTWNSVYDPEILRQAMIKDDSAMRLIIRKLKAAGVIEQVASGHQGSVAKFRFLRLAPTEAVDNPVDNNAEGGWISPPSEGDLDGKAGDFHTPSEHEGGRISPSYAPRRRVDFTPPTPHVFTPHTFSSSSASPYEAELEVPAPRAPHRDDDEEIAKEKNHNPNQRAAAYVAEKVGCTEAEAEKVVHRAIEGRTLRTTPLAYVRGCNIDDLRDHLTAARGHAVIDQGQAATAWSNWAEKQPRCAHSIPGGDLANPHTGRHRCSPCSGQVKAVDETNQPAELKRRPRVVMLNGGRTGIPRQDTPDPVGLSTSADDALADLRKQMGWSPKVTSADRSILVAAQ